MPSSGARDHKVLLVDDSATARSVLRAQLRDIGILEVEEAEDGAEAIDKLGFCRADLVICDLNMLPIDGIEFTRIVRNAKDSPNPFVPIIMLTADATRVQLEEAIAAGVNDFMAKPMTPETLHRHIAALVDRPAVYVREARALRPERSGAKALTA